MTETGEKGPQPPLDFPELESGGGASPADEFAHIRSSRRRHPAIALAASAVWGILSIILSPCHLASLPLIVGFISGQGRVSTARASGIATLFAVGILVTIAAIGAITAAAGRMMGDVGRWGNYFVAAIFFVVLIPFYAFQEAARVLGHDTMWNLFFRVPGAPPRGVLTNIDNSEETH